MVFGQLELLPGAWLCRGLCHNPAIPAVSGHTGRVTQVQTKGSERARNPHQHCLSVPFCFTLYLAVSIHPWKWHGRGRRFDPDQVHQNLRLCPPLTSCKVRVVRSSRSAARSSRRLGRPNTTAARLFRRVAVECSCTKRCSQLCQRRVGVSVS